jgi:hypothetical protein
MHSMHVSLEIAPQCSESACAKMLRYNSARFPGLWYPVTIVSIYVSNDSNKASTKVLARLSPIRVTRYHHGSDLRILSFPLSEVGVLTFGKP